MIQKFEVEVTIKPFLPTISRQTSTRKVQKEKNKQFKQTTENVEISLSRNVASIMGRRANHCVVTNKLGVIGR